MLNGLVLGGVSILIGADASGLTKEAKASEARMKQLERTASSVASKIRTSFALLVAAAPAALTALAKSSLDVIDTQSKLSRQVGGSLGAIQDLTRVADLAGVSQDELAGALGRLNRKLGEAMRDGLSPAADAFKKLGLNARDLSKMDVDKRIGTIADRLKSMGYNAQQTADWLGQIGIRGGKIAALFENGAAPIKEAREELDKFGVRLDSIDGEQIEIANDSLTIFGVALRGLGNQLALTASVIMPKVAKAFKDWGMQGEGIGKTYEKIIDELVAGFGVIPTMIYNVRIAWDAFMDFVIGSLNMFASAWDSTFGKLLFPLGQIKNEYGKLKDSIEAPPNIDGVRKMWKEWKDEARAAAEEGKKARDALTGNKDADTAALSSKEAKAMQEKLQALKQQVASEDEVLRLQRDKQLKDLAEFEQNKIITVQDANKVREAIDREFNEKMDKLKYDKFERDLQTENEQLQRKHDEQLKLLQQFQDNHTYTVEQAEALRAKIEDKYRQDRLKNIASDWSGIASIVDTAMGHISDIMGDESEKGFTIMKAISMATALVKGFEAAVSAYAFGARVGGPALGATMAGIAAAGTAAIIAKMAGVGSKSKGTTSGAGAAAKSGSGGGKGQAETPAAPQALYVHGLDKKGLFDGETVRDLANKLVQYQRDGGRVVIV